MLQTDNLQVHGDEGGALFLRQGSSLSVLHCKLHFSIPQVLAQLCFF
uniref:Uncharacterized protein n=1 Tax=Anguilla anguilla TaxID=7936 RepID=A0A0E9RNR6_ANGAN